MNQYRKTERQSQRRAVRQQAMEAARQRQRRVRNVVKIALGVIALGFLAVLIAFPVAKATAENIHTNCVVSSKDRSAGSDGASTYRVYTENCGVFEVGDALLKGKFDSADRYAKIKEGETYTFTSVGWRAPVLSMFPNIIEVEKTQ